jgi:succinate dehydrogenase/fumarate reductase flavoprotein subunit
LLPKDLKKIFQGILWNHAGIAREVKGLDLALESIAQIRVQMLREMRAEKPKEILEAMELENVLGVGEMIIRSARMREESRGAHFRKDCPQRDDQKWLGNIFLQKKPKGMHLEFYPLPGPEKIS